MTKHYIPEDEWDLHIQSEGCPCNPSVGHGVYNDTILYVHFRFFSGADTVDPDDDEERGNNPPPDGENDGDILEPALG